MGLWRGKKMGEDEEREGEEERQMLSSIYT